MTKKNLAIVFGLTSNLTFALANVIIGLKKHSPNLADDVIVYHDNILEKDQKIINSIIKTKFIRYEFPIKNTSNFDKQFFNQFSNLAYSRFECFNLLNEYKNVLYLDVDILIQKDISSIMEYSNNEIALLSGEKVLDNFFSPIEDYDMNQKGYWSGTIFFTDKMKNFDKMRDFCYEKLLKYASVLYLPDQAILSLLVQEFNLTPALIDKKIYCAHPIKKESKTAKIIHAYRPKKFWDCWNFKEWEENDKIWRKMGGTPFNGKRCCFLIRWIERIYPGAPHPLRKPRAFIKFIWMVTFNNPWKDKENLN